MKGFSSGITPASNPSFPFAHPKALVTPKRILMLCGLTAAASCSASPLAPIREDPPIDTLQISHHARILSADSLLGRATGTRELEVAGQYIASVCAEIGLLPLGGGNDYRIPVPMTRVTVTDSTEMVISSHGNAVTLRHGRDFLFNFPTAKTLRDYSGLATLVGTDAELRTSQSPLVNPVAVTLGAVSAQASLNLMERGAVAMIHLVSDTVAYNTLLANREYTLLVARDEQFVSSLGPHLPSVILSPIQSAQMYRVLAAGEPASVELRIDALQDDFLAHNIGCHLEGTAPSARRKVIGFSAHYDHLGIGPPNAFGDSIFNGFSDNAAGVGMLLAIAQTTTRSVRRFRNDLVFLFFTAEEIGLIGSDYFVFRPPIPLSQFGAVINLDAGAPPAPPWSWRIAGGDLSELGSFAVDAALARGWSATTTAAVANSDYYPFWRSGVPAIFIVPGVETFEGFSADSSRALRARWDRYHLVSDEWDPRFPLSGLGRYADYALMVARLVDIKLSASY